MSLTPTKVARESLSRSAAKNKSYVDLTANSEAEQTDEDDVLPLQTSKRVNTTNKRKRVSLMAAS